MMYLTLIAAIASVGVHAVSLAVPSGSPVLLGTAGNFAILSKAGISTVPTSVITGNIGVSPIAAEAMTGFDLVLDASGLFSTSTQFTGKAYAPTYVSPTPPDMTTAVSDMETAYNDAAGRSVSSAANLNVKAGLIAGTTFEAGVYSWGTDINFSSDIYLRGSSTSLFLFQSSNNLITGSGARVVLVADESGTIPLASNIVWQVAGFASVGTTSHLEGTLLVKTHAAFKTGASLNGRILCQTAVTLDSATITQPSVTIHS